MLRLEPPIERAIEPEEQAIQTRGHAAGEPVIDRPTQRWGLVLGLLVYGALSLLPFLPGEGWGVYARVSAQTMHPLHLGEGEGRKA